MYKFSKSVAFLLVLHYSVFAHAGNSEKTSAKARTLDLCDTDCVEVGSWSFSLALGLGGRTNPLSDGDDTPLIVLPELSYYGKRFFLKNLELGYTLWETPKHQFNLLAAPSFDQMHFNRWDINNFTTRSGFASTPWGRGSSTSGSSASSSSTSSSSSSSGRPLYVSSSSSSSSSSSGSIVTSDDSKLLDDMTYPPSAAPSSPSGDDGESLEGDGAEEENRDPGGDDLGHSAEPGGEEGGSEQSYYLKKRKLAAMAGFEYTYTYPRFSWHVQGLADVSQVHEGYELRVAAIIPFEHEKNRWALSLGLNYQSRSMLDYYYGLDSTEVSSADGLYSPKSAGLSQLLRLDWQRWVSRRWSWRATVQFQSLADEISASPITEDDSVLTFFVGGVYHF